MASRLGLILRGKASVVDWLSEVALGACLHAIVAETQLIDEVCCQSWACAQHCHECRAQHRGLGLSSGQLKRTKHSLQGSWGSAGSPQGRERQKEKKRKRKVLAGDFGMRENWDCLSSTAWRAELGPGRDVLMCKVHALEDTLHDGTCWCC